MVKSVRENRSSSGTGGTVVSERPRRKSIIEAAESRNGNRRLSGRRIAALSPEGNDTDQAEDKVSDVDSHEETEEEEDSKENRYKGRGSVSFNVKKDDLCSEEDEEEEEDEDGDQNNTLQASGQPDSELNKSTAEKRAQSLQRARFARRKRKRRKSQLKGTGGDKMNSSVCNEGDRSQCANNNGVVDLLGSQKYVQVNYSNKVLKLNAFEPIECIYDLRDTKDSSSTTSNSSSSHSSGMRAPVQAPPPVALPKVNVETLAVFPECADFFRLPPSYIKFVEKTSEELDEEVEYDMDEEDDIWLKLVNEERCGVVEGSGVSLAPISQEQFEILMDRLEKESYFQAAADSAQAKSPDKKDRSHNDSSLNGSKLLNESTADDALCCICLDGEGYNANAILFCDMCNLAVHQECYGVPYIPEGQWLCRRCIQSPSAQVQCILCPNRYGAFKQTDSGLWAHVFCAIWIPEVHFANTVFLEPVIGIENIDRARWKLMCYICRKRNVGACIQCDKFNCYTAFHVTCAQQAGLYMNIREDLPEEEPPAADGRKKKNGKKDKKSNQQNDSYEGQVRRCAYCDIHTPFEVLSPDTRKAIGVSSTTSTANMNAECEEAMKNAQKERMKKARKILMEKRLAPPQVCMPVIPKEKTQDIISRVDFDNKEAFFDKLTNYWLLKRYSRNGVPMLRRLQTMGLKNKRQEQQQTEQAQQRELKLSSQDRDTASEERTRVYAELKEQLVYWKRLRHDMEKARLLMELVRKREKLKRDTLKLDHLQAIYEINELNGVVLQRLLDVIREMDRSRTFHEPVDAEAVPAYYETIRAPMDLGKMQDKLNRLEYESVEQFEVDFNLVISNCMQFNPKKSHYYNLAYRLRDQVSVLINQAKRSYVAPDSTDERSQEVAKCQEVKQEQPETAR